MTMPDLQGYPLSDQVYELDINIYNFENFLGLMHELEINVFICFLLVFLTMEKLSELNSFPVRKTTFSSPFLIRFRFQVFR